MGNLAKKIDLDLPNGAKIANNEEIENIQTSENIINNETVKESCKLSGEIDKQLKTSVSNDNNDNDPSPEPADIALPVPVTVEDDEEYVSNISIDIDNISSRTGITKADLQAVCVGGNTSVAVPTDLPELSPSLTAATSNVKALGISLFRLKLAR